MDEASSSIQALVVLLASVPITFYVFRKLPPGRAAISCFVGSMMFLPELVAFKLPLMPALGKGRMTALAMLLATFFVVKRRGRPKLEWWWWLSAPLAFLCGLMIWRTNQDAYVFGEVELPPLTFKDGMYLTVIMALASAVVAYLGMRLVHEERDLTRWVLALAGGGLIYALLIPIELRFSPQLHRWVYGYHPHESFIQTMRAGGYRPTVFMAHGLATSLFMLGATMAAMLLARSRMRIWRLSGTQAAWILLAILALCKSMGVYFYGLFALPLVRWASAKWMTRVAVLLVVISAVYPYLRVTGQFPVAEVLDVFDDVSHERMLSLKFRFDNEDVLIQHALEKPWFGWGASYGRSRVYDEYGKDITTTDGGWIIAFGNGGVMGLIEYMFIPIFCVLTVARRIRKVRDARARTMLAALNLYVAIMWVDVLPNASFNYLPQFLGASLCGISYALARQKVSARAAERATEPATARPRSPLPVTT